MKLTEANALLRAACPVCHGLWRYLAAHLRVAHGETVLLWLP